MIQPGIEANRSCSGVESMEGKDLLALTSGAVNNPHCNKHLRYFLPLLCKIQVKPVLAIFWATVAPDDSTVMLRPSAAVRATAPVDVLKVAVTPVWAVILLTAAVTAAPLSTAPVDWSNP